MRSTRIGLAAVLVAIFGFAVGFGYLADKIAADFSGQIALGCLTFLGGIWLAFWNVRKSREKEAESRIFSQKAEVYQDLVNILRDIFMASKGWAKERKPEELAKSLMVIRYKMIVWGGQDTIRAIDALEAVPEGANEGHRFLAGANLYGAIRRDLGHQDDAALAEDLFLTQITASDKANVRRLIREAKKSGRIASA
jgi:cbb3-type cytochrome oxidase subunit 3